MERNSTQSERRAQPRKPGHARYAIRRKTRISTAHGNGNETGRRKQPCASPVRGRPFAARNVESLRGRRIILSMTGGIIRKVAKRCASHADSSWRGRRTQLDLIIYELITRFWEADGSLPVSQNELITRLITRY